MVLMLVLYFYRVNTVIYVTLWCDDVVTPAVRVSRAPD